MLLTLINVLLIFFYSFREWRKKFYKVYIYIFYCVERKFIDALSRVFYTARRRSHKLVQRVYTVKQSLSQNNCSIINIREGKKGGGRKGRYTVVCARVFDTSLIAVT